MFNLVGPQQATESYRIYDGSFDLYLFSPMHVEILKNTCFYTKKQSLSSEGCSFLSLDVPRWRNYFSQHFISIIIKYEKVGIISQHICWLFFSFKSSSRSWLSSRHSCVMCLSSLQGSLIGFCICKWIFTYHRYHLNSNYETTHRRADQN